MQAPMRLEWLLSREKQMLASQKTEITMMQRKALGYITQTQADVKLGMRRGLHIRRYCYLQLTLFNCCIEWRDCWTCMLKLRQLHSAKVFCWNSNWASERWRLLLHQWCTENIQVRFQGMGGSTILYFFFWIWNNTSMFKVEIWTGIYYNLVSFISPWLNEIIWNFSISMIIILIWKSW